MQMNFIFNNSGPENTRAQKHISRKGVDPLEAKERIRHQYQRK